MTKQIVSTVVEALLDLGIMLLYASFAGLLIAAISVSDHGLGALLPALEYAALLPLGALALIVGDCLLHVAADRRTARKTRSSSESLAGADGLVLR